MLLLLRLFAAKDKRHESSERTSERASAKEVRFRVFGV